MIQSLNDRMIGNDVWQIDSKSISEKTSNQYVEILLQKSSTNSMSAQQGLHPTRQELLIYEKYHASSDSKLTGSVSSNVDIRLEIWDVTIITRPSLYINGFEKLSKSLFEPGLGAWSTVGNAALPEARDK